MKASCLLEDQEDLQVLEAKLSEAIIELEP